MAGSAMRNYDRVDYAGGIASIRAMLGGVIADWAKKYITKDHEREDYRDQLLAEYVRLDLDPMSGLIIGDVRNDKDKGAKMNPYVTIGGMTVLADRYGRYGGIVPTAWQYRGTDPLPFSCTAGVIRKDFEQPTIITRRFNEVAQKYKTSGDLSGQWGDRPETMLEKSTLAVAFRMAFPSEMENMAPQELAALSVTPRRALVAVPSPIALPPPTAEENQSAMVRQHVAERAAADATAAAEPKPPRPAEQPPHDPKPAEHEKPPHAEPKTPVTPPVALAQPEHVSAVYRVLGIAPKGANHGFIIAQVAAALDIPTPDKWGAFTIAQLDEFIVGYRAAQARAKADTQALPPETTAAAKPPKGQEPLSKLQRSNIETRVLDLSLTDQRFAEVTRDASGNRTDDYTALTAEEAKRLIDALKELLSTPAM